MDATLVFVVSQPDQAQAVVSTTQYSISPSSAVALGGGTLSVTANSGTPFAGATNVTVNFGSTSVTGAVNPAGDKVTATIPAESASQFQVFISVTSSLGTTAPGPADLFTYGPTVVNVTPNSGSPAGGVPVDITGTGFTANSTIQFGTAAPISCSAIPTCFNGSTELSLTSPANSVGTVDVRVTNPALPASDQQSPATSQQSPPSTADTFTYGMSVTGVNPPTGGAGTTVTITGIGFTGVTSVTFEGVAATIQPTPVPTDTSITVTAPAGAGVADVQVTTTSGTTQKSPSDEFTYTGAGSTIVGLGISLAGGSPTPNINCNYKANGDNTCTISGVGCGGSATFYVESVDGSGNPVAVTSTGGLQVGVGTGASPNPVTIPQGAFSTFANGQAVTAQLSPPTCKGNGNGNNSESETVDLTATINGNTVTLAVTVKS